VQGYGAAARGSGVPAAAIAGIAGPAGGLPHLAQIQRSFGRHDVRHVQAHVGGPAAAGAQAMGTEAFATGDHVAFASAPSLHVAAHEAAHVVQQRGGVQLAGGVGQAGDAYEQHANAVADRVVRGDSAESLLDRHAAGAASASAHTPAVQCYGRDEHAALSTTYLIELYEFLKTPAGRTWARDHGYTDPNDLLTRIAADPVVKTNNEPVKPGEARHTAKLHGARTDFTFGEITAMMGDLFGHWESLYNADDSQREHLMGEDSTANNETYTHGEYLKLAAKNTSHFAGENLKAWADLHDQAIKLAMTKGSDETAFNQALFIEAASTHFLTDAFSAGHQFEKQPLLDAVQIDLQKRPLLAQNPQLQVYIAIANANDRNNIANLIVKAIHDRMNEEGFDVTNDKGMKWRTFGDGNLARSPETQRVAALAVFESRQQVILARAAVRAPDPKAIRDFFPDTKTRERANLQALQYIPWARTQVEQILYANRKEARTKLGLVGGYLIEHNLEAIGDVARERDLLHQQEFDRAHGGSGQAVMPQFEWRFGK